MHTVFCCTLSHNDPCGASGVQSDIQTFKSQDAEAYSIVTAIPTDPVFVVPSEVIVNQIDQISKKVSTNTSSAIKISIPPTGEAVEAICQKLAALPSLRVILDRNLLGAQEAEVYSTYDTNVLNLVSAATVFMASTSMAEHLSSIPISGEYESASAALAIISSGCKTVILPKHSKSSSFVSYDEKGRVEFVCHDIETFTAILTVGLAKNLDVPQAIKYASETMQSQLNNKLSSIVPHVYPPGQFVNSLIANCKNEWDCYTRHEFVKGIANGSLPLESFKHYIRQDYIFLRHYSRAYALVSFKERDAKAIRQAAETVAFLAKECELHINFCQSYGVTLEELENTPEASANLAYTRYVLEKGMSGGILDLRVAVAPCLLGYGEIGARLKNDAATILQGNPYLAWIEMYSSEEYQASCRQAREELERLAMERVPCHGGEGKRFYELCDVFKQATVLECNFWQMGLKVLS